MTSISFNDYLEIQNLVSEYFLTTDAGDVDAFMNCWVGPDEFTGYDLGAMGMLKTWEEMRGFIVQNYVGALAKGKRHISTNVKIQPVSDTQVLVSHDMIVVEVAENPAVFITGHYQDSVVVKTDKGWKFKGRKIELDSGSLKLLQAQSS